MQDFGNSSGIANAMNQSSNRFKKIVYNYDLISGKVNQVSYQPGEPDAYYHRYEHDAENRLTDVYTGRDSIMLEFFPEREAHYNYYRHGPLAQTILGQLQVQKQDYIYTLQGWLKGVNPDSAISGMVAKNVYGFTLNYYNNDYIGIGAGSPSAGIPSQLGGDNKPLFNGNISSMGVNIPKLGNSILYNFQYDQLNRLVSMGAWNSTNSAWGSLSKIDDYQERLTYDPNGNILSYLRNGTGGALNLNNYTYSYTAETNRLASITNSVNSSISTYSYDAIGNVIKDEKQNVNNADWNVYGKLQSVTKMGGMQINYAYNAAGTRSLKIINDTTEAYVRDASGNIMSVYKKAGSEPLKQSELNIYGSAMIGTVGEQTVLSDTVVLPGAFASGISKTFTRGEKEYLLTDHRGNNMVSITDRRQQHSTGGNTVDYYIADVKTATYYSAFGAISNSYNGDLIKYGFNGQRRSTEISNTAQTAEFWEYNGDVGRRWNVDPIIKEYESPFLCFNGNPILITDALGNSGTSTHTDKNGKVIAVFDDGDLGVYKHGNNADGKTPTLYQITKRHDKSTSAGGTKMGETYTPLGFADFDEYERSGKVTVAPNTKIDFSSTWATQKIQGLLKDNPTLARYFEKAGTGGDYDFKTKVPSGEGFYYGSLLFGKYASARDVGNMGAGIVSERSIVSNKVTDYGFGKYNQNNNSKLKMAWEIYGDIADFFSPDGSGKSHKRAVESIRQSIYNGEDKLSKKGIETGRTLLKTLKL